MNVFKIQNIIARVTHGVIGLDLRLQGQNKYLGDFISLKDEEINDALIECPQSVREVVLSAVKKVKISITPKMDKAQTLKLIDELEDILGILYALPESNPSSFRIKEDYKK